MDTQIDVFVYVKNALFSYVFVQMWKLSPWDFKPDCGLTKLEVV